MYDEIVGDLAENSPIAVVGWKLFISINRSKEMKR